MIEKMMAYGSAHGDPGEDRGRPQDPLVGPETNVHDAASVRRQIRTRRWVVDLSEKKAARLVTVLVATSLFASRPARGAVAAVL